MSRSVPISIKKGFTKDQVDKIGNCIIYFSERIARLSKTKLIKLLYLLEELSVKSFGYPFLNLDYKVWKLGPVNIDLYTELSEPQILKNYIKLTQGMGNEYFIVEKKKFSDDEFSNNEITLMDIIIKKYGKLSAKTLIDICHKEDTLWYKIASENNLLEPFLKNQLNYTEYSIELSNYIKTDKSKLTAYTSHKEFLAMYNENN